MRTLDGWRMVRSLCAWEHLREALVGHGERDVLRRIPAVRAWAQASVADDHRRIIAHGAANQRHVV